MELLRVAIIIPLLEDRFNKNKKDFYMKWEDLNTQNRAELIKLYVRNGVTSLDKMKEHYNSFGVGGNLGKKKPEYKEWVKGVDKRFLSDDYNLEAAYNELGYDMMEAWRRNPSANHLPDTYKLPNHITFSEESIDPIANMRGGTWIGDKFYPSEVNRMFHPNVYKSKGVPYVEVPYSEKGMLPSEMPKFNGGIKFGEGDHLFDEGGFLSKIKSLFAPSYEGTFNQAYSQAVKNGDEYFKWNGNRYNTKDSGEKRKPSSTAPDYSKYTFNQAYKKANKELPVNGEFGWRGNAYSANNSKETSDLEKMPTYKLWETVTGKPWSKAKEWGFTDGKAKTNMGLRKALIQIKTGRHDFSNPMLALGELTFSVIDHTNDMINYNFNVPKNEKPIRILDPKSGKNQGSIVFPTVLDSLAKHGFNTNTSPAVTFGLPAQESAMSPIYYEPTSRVDAFNSKDAAKTMFSAWDINNNPLSELWGSLAYTKEGEEEETMIKRGAPYAFRQYADYAPPSNVLDWSYDKFKSGTYNKGAADHTPAVLKRGKDFMKAKEVQDWFYNHWLPGQNNQQEWLNWWNSGANYASGGSLF